MKKLINALNDDRIGGAIFVCLIVLVIVGMTVYSCIRDHQGVRQPAPLELTECSTCSP
jgi:hypothetical protein